MVESGLEPTDIDRWLDHLVACGELRRDGKGFAPSEAILNWAEAVRQQQIKARGGNP